MAALDKVHQCSTLASENERLLAGAFQIDRDDAVAAWQAKPRVRSRWLDTHVNYIVLGESGLGKTTLISNLISSFQVATAATAKDGRVTTLSKFQADPDSLRSELAPMYIPECSRRVIISLQDTPGWGDDINLTRYLRVVCTFLLEQRIKDYEKLDGGSNLDPNTMCGQLQHSITACLYIVPPHRMKKVDLILMGAISQLVPIIPIIAKADTMTDGELACYRQELLSMLANPNKLLSGRNLPQLEVSVMEFSQTIRDSLGIQSLPLAVACSRESEPCGDPALQTSLGVNATDNLAQPVRHYKWGSMYPLNRSHSDLIVLEQLLLGDKVDSLYAMLDDSFNRYAAFCVAYEENDKQLALIAHDACQAGVPYLDNDNSVKARLALSNVRSAMLCLQEENQMLEDRLAAVEKEKQQLTSQLKRRHVSRASVTASAGGGLALSY